MMRIKIVRRPAEESIDGIRLNRFEPGHQYDLGVSLASYLIAEGCAIPVGFEEPEPALVVPFSETGPRFPKPSTEDPPNLKRERFPADPVDVPSVAADLREQPRK